MFFHSNVLHRSDQNASPRRRWAFLIAYNRATNNPVIPHHHPQYTALNKVSYTLYTYCNLYKYHMTWIPIHRRKLFIILFVLYRFLTQLFWSVRQRWILQAKIFSILLKIGHHGGRNEPYAWTACLYGQIYNALHNVYCLFEQWTSYMMCIILNSICISNY